MCTLGKRVYGNVPRVQIPPAAPVKNNSNQNGSDFFILLILLFFVFLLLINFEIKNKKVFLTIIIQLNQPAHRLNQI